MVEKENNKKECEEAKAKEIKNFEEYNAFEEVPYEGQKTLGTRYVLTRKDDGTMKARFVVKGFQEQKVFQSDSPTASRESLKLYLSVVANEKWTLKSYNVRSAFLQSNTLKREVFVKPPPEKAKPGFVWKLIKPVYGLIDASRQWFLTIKNHLETLGMTQSLGDSCLFYFRQEEKLGGLILLHVDDFLAAGNETFENKVMGTLLETFSFGKVSCDKFSYTGISIRQEDDKTIRIDQKNFTQSLPIYQYCPQDPDNILSQDENNLIRKSTGQLNWLSSQTRPDLSYDAFYLSTCLNIATNRDAKYSTKVLEKSKEKQVQLKFSHLGLLEDLHIELYVDASL